MMKILTLEPEEYSMLKRAFQGGFTHANSFYVNTTLIKNKNIEGGIRSYDETSAYPCTLVSEKFPMSKGKKVSVKNSKQFEMLLASYCCLFDLELFNVRPKILTENYISQSRCAHLEKGVINNGRVSSAEYLATTVTELDFEIIREYYEFDNYTVSNMYIYHKEYLPINFVKSILDLYEKKTILKGVEGKEVEYMNSKGQVNSTFGMCVTDICRPEIKYDGDWKMEENDIEESIDRNNKSRNRFLYYPWGVWVTAYARRNLFRAISNLGDDYVYADTDSVKFVNAEAHKEFFADYNEELFTRLNNVAEERGLDFNQFMPKTIKGEPKLIGAWDDEGEYDMFKTLGAKRYMYVKDNHLNLTVSGLNKAIAVPYLLNKYKTFDEVFNHFDIGLYVPPEHTGKLTHTYIDDSYEQELVDYKGNKDYVTEQSFIHLEPADYSLDIADEFVKFLLGVRYD